MSDEDSHERRTGRAPYRAALAAFLAASALLLAACSSPAVLANTRSSDEDLASAVLEGIERRDADALMRLSLTQEEFDRIVWPTLPASRPGVGMPASYLWQDTLTKSRAHLGRMLQEWGGRRLELLRIEFGGPTTDHGGHSVSRATRLIVRDEAGHERAVRLFGSVIRQTTGSKVYSYIVD